jgi:hypothetical protein
MKGNDRAPLYHTSPREVWNAFGFNTVDVDREEVFKEVPMLPRVRNCQRVEWWAKMIRYGQKSIFSVAFDVLNTSRRFEFLTLHGNFCVFEVV